jgi:hypothetical protein
MRVKVSSRGAQVDDVEHLKQQVLRVGIKFPGSCGRVFGAASLNGGAKVGRDSSYQPLFIDRDLRPKGTL